MQPLNLRPRLVIRPEECPELWERMSRIESDRVGVTVVMMLNRLVAYEKILKNGALSDMVQLQAGLGPGAMATEKAEAQTQPRGDLSDVATMQDTVATPIEADPVDGLLSALGAGGLSSFVSRPSEN